MTDEEIPRYAPTPKGKMREVDPKDYDGFEYYKVKDVVTKERIRKAIEYWEKEHNLVIGVQVINELNSLLKEVEP